MQAKSEIAVLGFLKKIEFPGIRLGEGNKTVCDYLKSHHYKFTPDLVAGPPNIEDAPIEGLFFIDIIQPTSDLLFKSKASKQFELNVPELFKEILQGNTNKDENAYIEMLPDVHHKCYLDALNKKLDKYAHKRKFTCNGQSMVTTNLGIVHHFNLGTVKENNISNASGLITLLDYFRFYKALAPSDNIDLRNAENLLLKEIVNKEQKTPYILAVGRELNDVPYLFLMIHVSIKKNNKTQDLALLAVNTFFLDNSDMTHPVHKWFASRILHPLSKKYMNDELTPEEITININKDNKFFS